MKPKFKPEEKGPMDKFVMVNIFSLSCETTDFNGFGNLIQLFIS